MVACFHSKAKLYFCLTPLKNVNHFCFMSVFVTGKF